MRFPTQLETLGLLAALGTAGFSVRPVYGQTKSACIYTNEDKLIADVDVLKNNYTKALHTVLRPFTCEEFARKEIKETAPYKSALVLHDLFTEGSRRFAETRCVDFLLVGVFSYNAYFNRSCRALSPPGPIIKEYGQVQAALKQSQSLVGEAVKYKVDSSTKLLDAFSQNFTPEYKRTSALYSKYKVGLGVGIGAVVLGAGLIIAGGALQAAHGVQTSPSGCPVDGLDFGCARQVDFGARVALFSVGGVFLAGGVVEALLVRRWIGRQQTFSAAAPPSLPAPSVTPVPAGEPLAVPAAAAE